MTNQIKALYPHVNMVYDHRFNPYELDVNDPMTQIVNEQLKSVVCLMKKHHLKLTQTGYELQAQKLANNSYKINDIVAQVGENERFSQELSAAYGSGYYLGNRRIATAGHCVPDDLSSVYAVFGFLMIDKDTCRTQFGVDEVYPLEKEIKKEYTPKNPNVPDYAVLKVGREVVGDHPPVDVNFLSNIDGLEIHMLGNPSGLPGKVTFDGEVKSVQEKIFQAKIDAFGGNSGSSIYAFTQTGWKTIGMLTSGKPDYDVIHNYHGTGKTKLAYHKVTEEEILAKGYEYCQKMTFLKPYVSDDGLNFFGHCPTQTCHAYDEKVYIHQGFGTVRVEERTYHSKFACCDADFDKCIEGVVFKNCHYSYEGMDSHKQTIKEENQKVEGSLELDLEEGWKFLKTNVWSL